MYFCYDNSFFVSFLSINWFNKFSWLPFINFGRFKKNSGFYLLTLQIPNWTINLVLHRLKSNVSEQFFLASQSATSINLGIGYPQSNRSLSIHLSFDKTPLFDCFFPLKIHDTLSCSSVRKKRAILTPFIESFVLCFQMNWSRGKDC